MTPTSSPLHGGAGACPWRNEVRVAASLALALFMTACPPPAPEPLPPIDAPTCDAGDEAFVREATLAILGRRPFSEAEVIHTPICDLLDIRVPVVQAGMGSFTSAELAPWRSVAAWTTARRQSTKLEDLVRYWFSAR